MWFTVWNEHKSNVYYFQSTMHDNSAGAIFGFRFSIIYTTNLELHTNTQHICQWMFRSTIWILRYLCTCIGEPGKGTFINYVIRKLTFLRPSPVTLVSRKTYKNYYARYDVERFCLDLPNTKYFNLQVQVFVANAFPFDLLC